MYPEEPPVPRLTMAFAYCLPRVLVQKLANHGLSDGMNDRRIGRARNDGGSFTWRHGGIRRGPDAFGVLLVLVVGRNG